MKSLPEAEGWTFEKPFVRPEDMNGGGQMVPAHWVAWARRTVDGAYTAGCGDTREEAVELCRRNTQKKDAEAAGILRLSGKVFGVYRESVAVKFPHALIELSESEADRIGALMQGEEVVIVPRHIWEKLQKGIP